MTGISVVIPVRNGAACLGDTLESVWAQKVDAALEILVVDDMSTDGSGELAEAVAGARPLRVLRGEGRGAAAAVNLGIREASHAIICQVDQDVVLHAGWLAHVVKALEAPGVAAAQGHYVTDPGARLLPRVMSLDLEMRYASVPTETDHVCTGNAAYRADALACVGLFDEALGYGYDNDMSYRLRAAGYRLVFCRDARSVHRWREGLVGYVRQQYGFGYGRLDLVAKHPRRVGGDRVSPTLMMLHPLALLVALTAVLVAPALRGNGALFARAFALVVLGGLTIERALVGLRATLRFKDAAALWFPVVHLARDLAWIVAIVVWMLRRVSGTATDPGHSMRSREGGLPLVGASGAWSIASTPVVSDAARDRTESLQH